jgi:PAT family beta-lactamase induction signal transducer AmpG
LLDRVGAGIALTLAVAIRAGTFLGVAILQTWWPEPYFMKTVMLIAALSGQIVTITIIALFMQICFKQISATQFAVYMALANLTLSGGSALVAPLDGVLDYQQMFYLMAILNIIFLILWPMLNLGKHRKDMRSLESEFSG